jgi:hypothetical protein
LLLLPWLLTLAVSDKSITAEIFAEWMADICVGEYPLWMSQGAT